MTKLRLRSWVKNILLFIFISVFCLFVTELILHLIYPSNISFKFDSNFGIIREGNVSFVNQYGALVEFNQKSLRGPEISYEKKSDAYRILALGDSFTLGVHVDFNKTYSQQMEQIYASESTPKTFEVINAGYSGFSTDKEVIFYLTEGYKYNPNLVILGFFVGNDLQDTKFDYLYSYDGSLHKNYAIELTYKEQLRQFLSINSRLFYLAQKFVALHLNDVVTPILVKIGIADPTLAGREIDYNIQQYNTDYLPEVAVGWEEVRELIELLKTSVETNGAELLVVAFPQDHQVDDFLYHDENIAAVFDSKSIIVDRFRPQKELAKICTGLNVRYLDLLPLFRKENDSKYKFYSLEFERHWTEKGHELTAEAIMDYLKKNDLVR